MPTAFVLLVPIPPGSRPEGHPSLLSLLDRARESGRPLHIEHADAAPLGATDTMTAIFVLREQPVHAPEA